MPSSGSSTGNADELEQLSVQIRREKPPSLPLMIFHSTKAEIFSAIFSQSNPVVGLGYPTFFFYGKPSFFCQFSDKLNRMALALPGQFCTSEEFTLHDSDLSTWSSDLSGIFSCHFGSSVLTLKGDFTSVTKAAIFIFGSNQNYFDGMDARPKLETNFLQKFSDYIRDISAIRRGQAEKAKTIELKSNPLSVDDRCVIFFVESSKSSSILLINPSQPMMGSNAERDSAEALRSAAEKAHGKNVKIVSCLDQRPSPSSLESLYEQLFYLVRKHSLPQFVG